MRKLLLFFLLVSSPAFSQQRQLIGTTVLTASDKNMDSRWVHGFSLDSISASECIEDPTQEYPGPTKINSVVQKNDSILIIDAQVVANCCFAFLGETEIVNDTLHLIYHGYGGFCSCNCCFGLTYTIQLYSDYGKHHHEQVKTVILNNWKSTAKEIAWRQKNQTDTR